MYPFIQVSKVDWCLYIRLVWVIQQNTFTYSENQKTLLHTVRTRKHFYIQWEPENTFTYSENQKPLLHAVRTRKHFYIQWETEHTFTCSENQNTLLHTVRTRKHKIFFIESCRLFIENYHLNSQGFHSEMLLRKIGLGRRK